MPRINQTGFVQTLVIPIVLVVVIVAGTGFFVINRRNSVNTATNQQTASGSEATQSTRLKIDPKNNLNTNKETQASVSAESKEWKRYKDNKSGISILFPHNWHHRDGMQFHAREYLISSLFLNDQPEIDKTHRKVEINVYPQSLDEIKKLLNYRHDLLKVEVSITETEVSGHKALKTSLQNIAVNVADNDEDMGANELIRQIKNDPNKLNYFISIDEKSTVELSYGTESAEVVEQMIQSLTFK